MIGSKESPFRLNSGKNFVLLDDGFKYRTYFSLEDGMMYQFFSEHHTFSGDIRIDWKAADYLEETYQCRFTVKDCADFELGFGAVVPASLKRRKDLPEDLLQFFIRFRPSYPVTSSQVTRYYPRLRELVAEPRQSLKEFTTVIVLFLSDGNIRRSTLGDLQTFGASHPAAGSLSVQASWRVYRVYSPPSGKAEYFTVPGDCTDPEGYTPTIRDKNYVGPDSIIVPYSKERMDYLTGLGVFGELLGKELTRLFVTERLAEVPRGTLGPALLGYDTGKGAP